MKWIYFIPVISLLLVINLNAQSFNPVLPELQQQIGKTIAVVDNSGDKKHGVLAKLDDSQLQMIANGKTYMFTPSELKEVRMHQKDSLWNGSLIGASIGGGVAALLVAGFCSNDDCSSGEAVGTVALYAGIGAAAGLGLDYMINKEIPIYRRPGITMSFSPQVGIRNGANFSLKF